MPYPDNRPDNDQVMTFGHLIITMRNGAANDRATAELEKLIEAIQNADDQKASGFVNIKVKVSKLKDGDTEMKVDMKVTSQIPVGAIPAGIYYPDDDHKLHRTDPRQMSMLEDRRMARERELEDSERHLGSVGRGRVIDGESTRG